MNYNLNSTEGQPAKTGTWSALRSLLTHMSGERTKLILSFVAITINAVLNLLGPLVVKWTIDGYIAEKNFNGVLRNAGYLLIIYSAAFITRYVQTRWMGGYGQRVLYALRNSIFSKLQELPVAFFNQNKAGDLISRINNDTDKLVQFFAQSLMQFVSSIFLMSGAAVFLLSINFKLGLAVLGPALLIWIFTKLISPWVKAKNAQNMQSTGSMSAEIQESLNNFKVIIAFNRRDYFRRRFDEANKENYKTAIGAGLANNIFMPVYGLGSNIAQLIVLAVGIYLISTGHFTVGGLISFLAYASNFYGPLQQLAALWANFQVALAGWDRIARILHLQSNLVTISEAAVAAQDGHDADGRSAAAFGAGGHHIDQADDRVRKEAAPAILEFRKVSFHYPDGKEVLHHNSFRMEKGKTYALVGPTGGGKTTTAYLLARLYDPTGGTVLLNGRDIRTYTPEERARKIGFILQEPFMFTGSVKDNILYGNEKYKDLSSGQLADVIRQANLEPLLSRFDAGLDTPVTASGDGISLGQKQLIAFMRAVLRDPDLLILDEATANIDTVTEKMLDEILRRLPTTTTRVIIAHRLNTIENADEIFFVNSGEITRAGDLSQAVDMLMHGKRAS